MLYPPAEQHIFTLYSAGRKDRIMFSYFSSGLTSLLLAFSMIFSSSSDIGKTYLGKTSADVLLTVSASEDILDSSLEIIDKLYNSESYYPTCPSVKSVIFGLCKSSYTLNVKYNHNPNTQCGNMYAEDNSQINLSLNPNFAINTNIVNNFWVEYDFSSSQNFKCLIYAKTPEDTRYVVCDLSRLIDENKKADFLNSDIQGLKNLGGHTDYVAGLIKQNSTKSSLSPSHTQITLTSENAENLIMAALYAAEDEILKDLPADENAIQSPDETFRLTVTEPVKEFFKKSDLFADDAAVIDIYFDDNKNISSINAKINFSFNLKNFLAASDELEYGNFNPLHSGNENATADFEFEHDKDAVTLDDLPDNTDDFKLSLNLNLKYNLSNTPVKLNPLPELDRYNTYNVYEESVKDDIKYNDYDKNSDLVPSYLYPIYEENLNVCAYDEASVPLRALISTMCDGRETITYNADNGEILIESNDSSPLFKTLRLTLGSCDIVLDDKTYTIKNPVYEKNGSTRLTNEILSVLWDGEIYSYAVDAFNSSGEYKYRTEYRVVLPNPIYNILK